MTPLEILASPYVIAAFALAAGYAIYTWSAGVAPPFSPSRNKTMPYVGGEAAVAQKSSPGYQFFSVALFFVVVHVAALVLALTPADAPPWASLGYLAIIAAAVVILRCEQ